MARGLAPGPGLGTELVPGPGLEPGPELVPGPGLVEYNQR